VALKDAAIIFEQKKLLVKIYTGEMTGICEWVISAASEVMFESPRKLQILS
jgi:hypothetical protein